MVVSHIETRSRNYLVLDFGDPCITIYRNRGKGPQEPKSVEFRTPEDYRRFMVDLGEAQKHPDSFQEDIVVEKLLGKLKVEWTGEE